VVTGSATLSITALAQGILQPASSTIAQFLPPLIGLGIALGFQPLRRLVQDGVDRVLPAREERALFFTDIVGSTALLAATGDALWRIRLGDYRAAVRRELKRFDGTEMHIAGDSFFATFTDPVRAVRCAEALADRLQSIELPSRFGLHWGVCEMRGPEVSGLAVWIAARVMALAGAGEIVASEALREAIAESGITMSDRGQHELKGVPGRWQVYTILSNRTLLTARPRVASRSSTPPTSR
jgi:class 3 adenylate cyclase